MKVTNVRTVPVHLPLETPITSAIFEIRSFGCVLVFVETDAGLVGENLVFTVNNQRFPVLHEMVRSLAPLIVGQDPAFSGRFWRQAWREINFLGHKGVPVMGISAIDGALWDLRAKAAGLPLHRLLGACRETVPAYHSGGLWLSAGIDDLQQQARGFLDQGFRAMKMRLGMATIRKDIERVRAVRDAVGADVALMADANQQLTLDRAIRLGRALEEFGLTWFEEPLPAYDLEGVARVAAALDTPIASGETEYTRYGFRQMLELKSADVLMPDLQRVGGVTEFMKVAHMADAHDVPVSSHLFPEMSLPVLAALGNATYLEYMPWFSPLYRERIEFRDGAAVVPERAGWGFSFDPKAVRSYAAGT